MRTVPRTFAVTAVLLLCAAGLFAADAPRLVFAPPEWKFDMVLQGAVVEETVTVTNREAAAVLVTFVPTCSCLTVSPAAAGIPPGGSGAFRLRYDSSDDTGVTTRGYIVRTDLPAAAPLYYLLRGVVRAERTAASTQGTAGWPAAPAAGIAVTLDYYYTPGCRSCEEFLSATLPRLASSRGLVMDLRLHDLLVPAAFEELTRLASARGESLYAVPALLVHDVLLQGEEEIRTATAGLMEAAAAVPAPRQGTTPAPAATAGAAAALVTIKLAALPIAAAGLLDGINPCAFTTLIFLLASLALAGRRRSEVLLIGSLFSLSVFLSYLLIGLGFFAALRAAGAVPIVSAVLRWVLVAALAVFAGLSVYDYTLIRRGRAAEMVLQLPSLLKRKIHASIRTRVRAAALAGSSLVLGFLVSIFEFACTGQVYLPTLAYLARAGDRGQAAGLLVLYNLAFILPLLLVFGASYAGVSSAKITAAFQRHMGAGKIGLALVFAALAVVTLVG